MPSARWSASMRVRRRMTRRASSIRRDRTDRAVRFSRGSVPTSSLPRRSGSGRSLPSRLRGGSRETPWAVGQGPGATRRARRQGPPGSHVRAPPRARGVRHPPPRASPTRLPRARAGSPGAPPARFRFGRGEPRLAFQHRRLREVPPSGGPSSYREAVSLDPLLLEHATLLLRELGWTGLAMVEFKCGVRGARLMEINGRIWGSLPLAVASGVDFPLHLAELMMGRTLSDLPSSYVIGRKRRNMELEVAWVAQVLFSKRDSSEPASRTPRRRALALLMELSLAWREMDNYWEDDLRPLAAEVLRAAGRLQRKLGFHLVRTQWPLSQALRRVVERIAHI